MTKIVKYRGSDHNVILEQPLTTAAVSHFVTGFSAPGTTLPPRPRCRYSYRVTRKTGEKVTAILGPRGKKRQRFGLLGNFMH